MSLRYFLPLLICLKLGAATETLRYNVNWPSGLSLGEATLVADNLDASAASRKFEFRLDASVPGFSVFDEVLAAAKPDYCTTRLEKRTKHGAKTTQEVSEFKPEDGVVERKTEKGGTSKLPMGACGRDALTLVYFIRSELKQGRVPSSQSVYFGAAYNLSFKYAGAANVQLGSGQEVADKIQISIKGPASQNTLELFVGRDALRTPLLFRVPLPLGTFSMELQR